MRKKLEPHEVRFYVGGFAEQLTPQGELRKLRIENARLKGSTLILKLADQHPITGGAMRSEIKVRLRHTRVAHNGGRLILLARWMDNRPISLHPAIEHRANARMYAEYRWVRAHGKSP